MKPEFSKPFNVVDAHAGAPIGTVGGDAVEILKWNYRVSEGVNHILGLIVTSQCEIPSSWKFDGTMPHGYASSAERYLVMLPLGLIDGKPVFVGDEVQAMSVSGENWISITVKPGDQPRDGHCRWPASAKVYPTSVMHTSLLIQAFDTPPTVGSEMLLPALQRVADAAIRFSIDAGQVVPVSKAKPGLRPHCPYTGKLRDPRDIETDPMGVLVRHPEEPLRGIEGRAARDMAIAEAVRNAAYVEAMNCQSGHEGTVIRQIDLSNIISTVK